MAGASARPGRNHPVDPAAVARVAMAVNEKAANKDLGKMRLQPTSPIEVQKQDQRRLLSKSSQIVKSIGNL